MTSTITMAINATLCIFTVTLALVMRFKLKSSLHKHITKCNCGKSMSVSRSTADYYCSDCKSTYIVITKPRQHKAPMSINMARAHLDTHQFALQRLKTIHLDLNLSDEDGVELKILVDLIESSATHLIPARIDETYIKSLANHA